VRTWWVGASSGCRAAGSQAGEKGEEHAGKSHGRFCAPAPCDLTPPCNVRSSLNHERDLELTLDTKCLHICCILHLAAAAASLERQRPAGRLSDAPSAACGSVQMFKKPVQQARAGDRVGICVTQLDAKAVERGILVRPASARALVKQRLPSGSTAQVSPSVRTIARCSDGVGDQGAEEAFWRPQERFSVRFWKPGHPYDRPALLFAWV
jgi:hypothetical protein